MFSMRWRSVEDERLCARLIGPGVETGQETVRDNVSHHIPYAERDIRMSLGAQDLSLARSALADRRRRASMCRRSKLRFVTPICSIPSGDEACGGVRAGFNRDRIPTGAV